MYAQSFITILALAASAVSALPQQVTQQEPTPVDSAPISKRTNHFGTGTVYDQDGAAGSCGQVHGENDMIVAITPKWQGYSYPPAYCGRKVKITNTGSSDSHVGGKGKTIIATVADTCPGCRSADSIDMSRGAWNALTNHAGPSVVNIEWHFCNANGSC